MTRFARSSESETLNGVQASLLSEAIDCDLAAIEEELEQLCERPKSAATHRPRRQALPVHLPRVELSEVPERLLGQLAVVVSVQIEELAPRVRQAAAFDHALGQQRLVHTALSM